MTDLEQPLTNSERRRLRELLDKAAITETLHLYWHALDSRSFDLLDDVFAPEVELHPGRPPIPRDDVKRLLAGVSQFPVSHHGPRTIRITVEGDRARANSFAMDFLA